jgi:hypothetical protein
MNDNDVKHIIARGTAEGISVALGLLVQQERIPRTPTDKSANPFDDVGLLITAEFEKGSPSYPFSESLKDELVRVMQENTGAISLFKDEGNAEMLKKLVVVLACGQTLEFLKPRVGQVFELFRRVREEGIVQLPKGGPSQ